MESEHLARLKAAVAARRPATRRFIPRAVPSSDAVQIRVPRDEKVAPVAPSPLNLTDLQHFTDRGDGFRKQRALLLQKRKDRLARLAPVVPASLYARMAARASSYYDSAADVARRIEEAVSKLNGTHEETDGKAQVLGRTRAATRMLEPVKHSRTLVATRFAKKAKHRRIKAKDYLCGVALQSLISPEIKMYYTIETSHRSIKESDNYFMECVTKFCRDNNWKMISKVTPNAGSYFGCREITDSLAKQPTIREYSEWCKSSPRFEAIRMANKKKNYEDELIEEGYVESSDFVEWSLKKPIQESTCYNSMSVIIKSKILKLSRPNQITRVSARKQPPRQLQEWMNKYGWVLASIDPPSVSTQKKSCFFCLYESDTKYDTYKEFLASDVKFESMEAERSSIDRDEATQYEEPFMALAFLESTIQPGLIIRYGKLCYDYEEYQSPAQTFDLFTSNPDHPWVVRRIVTEHETRSHIASGFSLFDEPQYCIEYYEDFILDSIEMNPATEYKFHSEGHEFKDVWLELELSIKPNTKLSATFEGSPVIIHVIIEAVVFDVIPGSPERMILLYAARELVDKYSLQVRSIKLGETDVEEYWIDDNEIFPTFQELCEAYDDLGELNASRMYVDGTAAGTGGKARSKSKSLNKKLVSSSTRRTRSQRIDDDASRVDAGEKCTYGAKFESISLPGRSMLYTVHRVVGHFKAVARELDDWASEHGWKRSSDVKLYPGHTLGFTYTVDEEGLVNGGETYETYEELIQSQPDLCKREVADGEVETRSLSPLGYIRGFDMKVHATMPGADFDAFCKKYNWIKGDAVKPTEPLGFKTVKHSNPTDGVHFATYKEWCLAYHEEFDYARGIADGEYKWFVKSGFMEHKSGGYCVFVGEFEFAKGESAHRIIDDFCDKYGVDKHNDNRYPEEIAKKDGGYFSDRNDSCFRGDPLEFKTFKELTQSTFRYRKLDAYRAYVDAKML
jgi:hypothetical protein